jgi:hypothetical protein
MRHLVKTLFILFVIAIVSTACIVPFGPRLIRGSGDVIEVERKVSGFDKISISGAGKVIVTQGDEEYLTIETDDNLVEYIETEVNGKTLEIGFKEGTVLSPGGGRRVLEATEGFTFRIGVKELKSVSLSGAARFEMEKLKTDDFEVNLSGAGDISFDDINADRLDVVLSGAGDVQVAGKVESQDVSLSGLGRYQAFDLESQETAVNISGAGGAEVWVTDLLEVVISGAGDVKYYGEPEVFPEISGLGRIQGMGEK